MYVNKQVKQMLSKSPMEPRTDGLDVLCKNKNAPGCDLTERVPIDQPYFIVGQNLLKRRQQNKIEVDKAVYL